MNEANIRNAVITAMRSFIGAIQGDESTPWREIITIYNDECRCEFNTVRWGTRSTKMLDSYGWCATAVSSAIMKAARTSGVTINQVAPIEMGPNELINMAQANGIWQPKGNGYGPQPGDILLMSSDSAVSGRHVGLIAETHDSYYTTIEGNTGDPRQCMQKTREKTASNILGVISPLYCTIAEDEPEPQPEPEPVPTPVHLRCPNCGTVIMEVTL